MTALSYLSLHDRWLSLALLCLLLLGTNDVHGQTMCAESDDCLDTEYCAGGTCLGIGNCTALNDCFNPNNSPYSVILCVGYFTCTAGACGVECGPEECPDNIEFTPCDGPEDELPCAIIDCPEADGGGCYNDPCSGTGSCSAIFYDAAGDIVCQQTDTLPTAGGGEDTAPPQQDKNDKDPVSTGCETDDDCEVDIEICLAGLCTPFDETMNTTDPEPGTLPIVSCTSDDDCDTDTEYCASGSCLFFGECAQETDCRNPSNSFEVIACVGILACEEGLCSKTCGAACPDGSEEVNCFASPCETSYEETCPDAVSCAADYCGGCNALLFDSAGIILDCQVETEPEQEPEPEPAVEPGDEPGDEPEDPASSNSTAPDFCTKDSDCIEVSVAEARQASTYYCAQGVCMESGSCNSELDCYNPANVYPVIECVGALSCDSGVCGRICGPACADGTDFVLCEPPPCENATAPCEGSVSCVNNQCGGCNAIYFDAGGNEVSSCTLFSVNAENGGEAGDSGALSLRSLMSLAPIALFALALQYLL